MTLKEKLKHKTGSLKLKISLLVKIPLDSIFHGFYRTFNHLVLSRQVPELRVDAEDGLGPLRGHLHPGGDEVAARRLAGAVGALEAI